MYKRLYVLFIMSENLLDCLSSEDRDLFTGCENTKKLMNCDIAERVNTQTYPYRLPDIPTDVTTARSFSITISHLDPISRSLGNNILEMPVIFTKTLNVNL